MNRNIFLQAQYQPPDRNHGKVYRLNSEEKNLTQAIFDIQIRNRGTYQNLFRQA